MSLDDVLAEVRRLSIDGVAPSRDRYDQQRRRDVASSRQIRCHWGLAWADVVEMAGLRLSLRSLRATGQRGAVETPPDVEEEIRRLLPANRRLERDDLDRGLEVLAQTRRVVERQVVRPDGSVVVVRRESYSLR